MRRRQLLIARSACTVAATRSFAQPAEAGVSNTEILLGQSALISGELGQQILAFNKGVHLALNEGRFAR